MKRIFLLLTLIGSMALGGMAAGYAQDEELFDKKDTVSIDDMDPVFYEAEEENAKSQSSTMTVVIVAGVVVVLGGAYFFMKKRKTKK